MNKRILLIFLTVFIDLVGFGIIIPMNPYLAKQFGASAVQVGWLMSIYSLMQFVFAPVWGRLSDIFGRRPIILIGLLTSCIAHLGFAFAESYSMLFVFRLFAGVGGGNLPVAMAYMADITDEKNRSKGMGLIGAAFGLGFILGPALGGVFSDFGHQLGSAPPLGGSFPGVLASAICFVNFLGAYFYLPESKPKEQRSGQIPFQFPNPWLRFKKIFLVGRQSGLFLLYWVYFLTGLSLAIVEVPLFLYVSEKFGWKMSEASYGFAYIGVLMVFTQGYLIRKMLPRMGEKWVLPIGLVFLSMGLLGSSFGATPWLLAPFVSFLAIGYGLSNPTLTGSISLLSESDVQGENMGVAQSLAALARILGPVTGSFVFQEVSLEAPFILSGLVAFVGLVLSIPILSRLRSGERGAQ